VRPTGLRGTREDARCVFRLAVLRERFECEAGYGLEDCVVGDERDPETDCGRGDPAVGVVLALRESVTDRGAIGAQLGTDRHELGAGMDVTTGRLRGRPRPPLR